MVRALAWRKSSFSGVNNGDCVEVAVGHLVVGVRDSKNTDGGILTFDPAGWRAFLTRQP
ncbi:DUF397 domain-containing protein [Kibdelosporangium phytohabitans]|uniref:DUF397 domain-containing protein n=1 Tax=Kibdelosporangium phytohabitans TaxID=860235 RepID=UPI0009F85C85|nr:DUF397 domain-containing protein [Kibdelosporangium phytohabitans]MBE1461287.1 hypothetical protein [Kibdelosporangium phytohabitans]